MTDLWTFEIPGPPVAKQRPRRSPDGHFYTPQKTRSYEDGVAWNAQSAGVRLEPGRNYGVTIDLYLSTRRKDADNIGKGILDGLQKMPGRWNDNQVNRLLIRINDVADGKDERAVVTIEDRGESQ
jgi:crossover junction endodeoxyribonuclease RusA